MNINPNEQFAESQRRMVRKHLEDGKTITALDALMKYGCLRLSSVIFDLRAEGMAIKTGWHKLASGKRIGIYSL